MSTARSITKRSLTLKGLGLAALLLSVWATSTPAKAATFCFIGVSEVVSYYTDATHTKLVGFCDIAGSCGPGRCFGSTSDFAVFTSSECEVCTTR